MSGKAEASVCLLAAVVSLSIDIWEFAYYKTQRSYPGLGESRLTREEKEINMTEKKILDHTFRKASFSGDAGCVEVAMNSDKEIVVRDSKNPGGGVLRFDAHEWNAFIRGVKAEEFELS